MLNIVLPSGSLQGPTTELFAAAGLAITAADSRSYEASIDDPRASMVRWMRPQEIPVYVAEGLFDIGIGGYDWIEERQCQDSVEVVAKFSYSRQTNRPVRLVVAVAKDAPMQSAKDILPGSRITTEYVEITRKYFASLGIPVKIEFSYGATEAKIPEIADVAVELTESGSSLRANGLKIIDTVMESSTVLMVNKASWADPTKRQPIEELLSLLNGTLAARNKVLLKMNVPMDSLDAVLDVLPSMKNPTISKLAGGDVDYWAVESVVEKSTLNVLIPQLKAANAEGILELPIAKIIP